MDHVYMYRVSAAPDKDLADLDIIGINWFE